MSEPGLLTIGEFARRSRLSIKALRLYDRSGLLRPAEVHPDSGYRLYATRQLYAARLIVLLRRLDMPLSQIAEILTVGSVEGAAQLDHYWHGVEQRLAAQRELADRLVRSLTAETPEPGPVWPVQVRDVAEQIVLTEQRHVTSRELAWTREATERLLTVAERHGGTTGPPFVLFHGPVSEDADGLVEVCVPVGADTTGTRREPAHAEAYVPVERGHFEAPRILSVYDAVHHYVRSRGLQPAGPSREVYGYPAEHRYVCDVAVPFR